MLPGRVPLWKPYPSRASVGLRAGRDRRLDGQRALQSAWAKGESVLSPCGVHTEGLWCATQPNPSWPFHRTVISSETQFPVAEAAAKLLSKVSFLMLLVFIPSTQHSAALLSHGPRASVVLTVTRLALPRDITSRSLHAPKGVTHVKFMGH